MKAKHTCWALVAWAAISLPVCAQRGSSHAAGGGAVSHSGGMAAPHGGPGAPPSGARPQSPFRPAAPHFGGAPGRMAPTRAPLGPGSSVLHRPATDAGRTIPHYGTRPVSRTASTNIYRNGRPTGGRGYNRRRTVHFIYGGGYGWNGYGFAPWLFYPWLDGDLSYDLWHDSGDPGTAPAAGEQDAAYTDDGTNSGNNQAMVAENDDPDAPLHPTATQAASDIPPATLVFRDGRAPLRVGNYVVSPQAVVIADGGRVQRIPITEIDITATNSLNAQSGSSLVIPQ